MAIRLGEEAFMAFCVLREVKGMDYMDRDNEIVLLKAELEACKTELAHRDTYIKTHIEVERAKNASLKQQLQLANQHIINLEQVALSFLGKVIGKCQAIKRKLK
jgi:hypothetical protein